MHAIQTPSFMQKSPDRQIHRISPIKGVGDSHANPRFQPTSVGWNLELTGKFPTHRDGRIKSHHIVGRLEVTNSPPVFEGGQFVTFSDTPPPLIPNKEF